MTTTCPGGIAPRRRYGSESGDMELMRGGTSCSGERQDGTVTGVWTEYENPWPFILVIGGVTALVCALLPVAKSGVSLGLLALIPVGLLAIVPAVIAIGEQGQRPGSTPPDKFAQRTVLRFALGMAAVGIVGCWAALALYPGVVLQVMGAAAGIGFLSIGTIGMGWYLGMRRSSPLG